MSRTTSILMGVRRMIKLYESMLKEVCEEYQLAQIEVTIISFLYNNPGKDTAGDIAELRMLSKGNVSQAVENLIQKSLIQRIPDESDRRKIHLSLLPAAAPITERIQLVEIAFRQEMFRGFSAEERQTFDGLFDRIMDNTKQSMKRGRVK